MQHCTIPGSECGPGSYPHLHVQPVSLRSACPARPVFCAFCARGVSRVQLRGVPLSCRLAFLCSRIPYAHVERTSRERAIRKARPCPENSTLRSCRGIFGATSDFCGFTCGLRSCLPGQGAPAGCGCPISRRCGACAFSRCSPKGRASLRSRARCGPRAEAPAPRAPAW